MWGCPIYPAYKQFTLSPASRVLNYKMCNDFDCVVENSLIPNFLIMAFFSAPSSRTTRSVPLLNQHSTPPTPASTSPATTSSAAPTTKRNTAKTGEKPPCIRNRNAHDATINSVFLLLLVLSGRCLRIFSHL